VNYCRETKAPKKDKIETSNPYLFQKEPSSMYCIVSRRVLSPLGEEERQALQAKAHLHTLSELLEAIPDPRGKHGLRYDLPFSTSLSDRRPAV
jgi:hypothetical protein